MNKASGKLKKIQELCLSKNIMISTAESCTGGYLSKLLTDISGSSKFYVGSVIAYSNSVKNDLLNVPNDILEKYGAVSEEVSLSMAEGIYNSIKSDIAISTTGVMEQDGSARSKKPQVFITIKSEKTHVSSHFYLHGERDINRKKTVNHVLDCLYDFINNHYLLS